ncbi:MAG: alpha/beta fold hydrolase [Chloroflexi bacterium]|nr:alpha/beta fold hydrolase [Chloroflexota bacterium]
MQQVSFYSQSTRLVGHVHLPDGLAEGERRPGIVLCHGFNAAQTVAIPDIAAHLCAAGYAVLRFDYRGIGLSDGPRGRIVPPEHVQDVRNALTFMQAQDHVDADRLGLYGTSFGGSHAVMAAAVDERVRALVSTVSIGNGRRWLRSMRRHWEFAEFLRRLDADRRQRVLTGESAIVSPYDIMVPDPVTQAVHAERARLAGRPAPDIVLESGEAILEYAPEEVVDRIAPRAALFIHAADDALVPAEESIAMHARAGEPKRLVLVPNAGHYDLYSGPGFARVMAEATDWFDAYLRA